MAEATQPATTLVEGAPIESNEQPSKPFFTPPTYTMKEIHDAIPPHCFQRNTLLSLFYILRDYFFIGLLFSVATQIPLLPSHALRVSAWIAYSAIQGLLFTGVWELAHECGHGALSPYKAFNNTAGLIIHSLLLVPYHSWRFTHSTHHKSTNNIERDVAFVPDTKDVWQAAREARRPELLFTCWDLIEDMPIVNLLILVGHQLVAWPLYLILNNFALPRMRAVAWWKRSHLYFGGDGPNFKPENRDDIILSDIGVGIVGLALWAACRYFGAGNVFLFYGAPWLWTNHWICAFFMFYSLPSPRSKSFSHQRNPTSNLLQ
jgi:omega-6 fatty acid desaturase (delta-12 desaturase)